MTLFNFLFLSEPQCPHLFSEQGDSGGFPPDCSFPALSVYLGLIPVLRASPASLSLVSGRPQSWEPWLEACPHLSSTALRPLSHLQAPRPWPAFCSGPAWWKEQPFTLPPTQALAILSRSLWVLMGP